MSKSLTKFQKAKISKIKANRKTWLKALRSGKYKQATDALKETEYGVSKYCCLGVARACIKGLKRDDELLDPANAMNALGLCTSELSCDTEKWSRPNGLEQDTLAEMNDTGTSFKAIAKIIESAPISL